MASSNTVSDQRDLDAAADLYGVTRLPWRANQHSDAKEQQRDTRRTARAAAKRGFAPSRRDDGAPHPNTGVVWAYPEVAMPERDKPTGKSKKDSPFFGMPHWYSEAMRQQSITPAEFAYWRTYVVNLTTAECGALLRVDRKTIEHWERGRARIPFAVWYVMHCYLQRPDVWLSRCGFTDLYVTYRNGIAYLCSAEYPDIEFTHGQLVYYAQAMQHLASVEARCAALEARANALVAENTELRRMFKGAQVTAELERMRDQIGDLLSRMHTADVYPFPLERDTPQAAAAGAR